MQHRHPHRRLLSVAVLTITAVVPALTAAHDPPGATKAPALSSGEVVLRGFLEVPLAAFNTDVWGWVNPVNLREYALVGNNATGLHIVDVTQPSLPVTVATADTVGRFDIKTWGHYVYTVDGNYGFNGRDGDIIDISDPHNPVAVGRFPAGHNLFVDDQGFLYRTFPGLEIFDLKPDPTQPRHVWGKVATEGHDATVVGDRLYDFHGHDGTFIYDVTSRSSPVLLGSITDTTIAFHHSGWPTGSGNYLFICDEFALAPSPDITVWDISDPSTPWRVAEIGDPDATVHNCYAIGNYLYVADYTAGFRVYDITDPTEPVLAGEYDTTPLVGENDFRGAWGCYPFAPSGNIYVNDRPVGFFVFSFDEQTTGVRSVVPTSFTLRGNYPNPFNPVTTISYELFEGGHVTLAVYDVTGKIVRTLVDRWQPSGPHHALWDGRDQWGGVAAAGVYVCRLEMGGVSRTLKMTLLK
jgi:hypothetical protein